MKDSAEQQGQSALILCDDDAMQYARKLSESKYRLIQMALHNPGKNSYMVYTDVITLLDYLDQEGNADEELTFILKSFGYDDISHVSAEYGDAANQIMCECIFESLWPHVQPCFTGTQAQCGKYISEYVSREK